MNTFIQQGCIELIKSHNKKHHVTLKTGVILKIQLWITGIN